MRSSSSWPPCAPTDLVIRRAVRRRYGRAAAPRSARLGDDPPRRSARRAVRRQDPRRLFARREARRRGPVPAHRRPRRRCCSSRADLLRGTHPTQQRHPVSAPPSRALPARPAIRGRAPPAGWLVWAALGVVYLVWGSTYLAIRVMVETVPPFLCAGVRFVIAGAAMLAFLACAARAAVLRPSRRAAAVLPRGRHAAGCRRQRASSPSPRRRPVGLAALLVASVPLWVVALPPRCSATASRAAASAPAVGFAGVALLLLPGKPPGGAPLLGAAVVRRRGRDVGAAARSPRTRLTLPRDPLVSSGWQMLLGGGSVLLTGALVGRVGRLPPRRFSSRSLVAFAYLVVFGSWLAFTAYAWLLQNAPVSQVADIRVRQPGRGDRARLGDPRRAARRGDAGRGGTRGRVGGGDRHARVGAAPRGDRGAREREERSVKQRAALHSVS